MSAHSQEPSASFTVDRRTALRWGAVGAGVAGLAAGGVAIAQDGFDDTPAPLAVYGQGSALPFLHGVASGDPLPTSVVLWTRVTPDRDALPGSGLGQDIQVKWEIARDDTFGEVVASGTEVASASTDHTVHVDPLNLAAETVYYYRFQVLDGAHAGAYSPVGRTKTAPDFVASPEKLSFAIASCANFESGHFTAYRHMAERGVAGDIDFVAFLGDYIYEYETGAYAGKSGVARPHYPSWEIVTLEDYRMRYGRYRTDMNLQAAHAAVPWIVIWDDHETANNAYNSGAENHTEGFVEGPWDQRYSAALQAYYEWMPLRRTRLSPEGHLYRSLRFGDLMELTMMDLRSYRDAESKADQFADPSRSVLGAEQCAWLEGTIAASDAQWMVMGNSVMMAPMRLLTLPGNDAANEALRHMQAAATGVAVNSDQWDGYDADRVKLLDLLEARGGNTFFITGDIHSEWANSIVHKGREIACEMVTTSITAPNVDEILTQYTGIYHAEDNSTSRTIEDAIKGANPWVRHLDYDAHGYGIARVGRHGVDMEFYRVSDVEDSAARVGLAVQKRWEPKTGFLS